MTDFDLLCEYALRKSEDAFATLVSRYARLVYSAAVRQSGNAQDAEEITQAVFIILARKASGMRRDTILPGWLLRTTRFVALNTRRRQLLRSRVDQLAMGARQTETDTAWEQMASLLDDALVRLSEKDRNAVVLRFFEQQSFKEIAQTMGTTEDGVQKRVARALEKLRAYFVQRGLVLPLASIVTAIAAKAVQPVPSQLMASITSAVTSGAAAAGTVSVLVRASLAVLEAARTKTLLLRVITVALAIPGAWLIVVISLRLNSAGDALAQNWTPTGAPTNFWRSIATSADGTKLVATVSGVGLIYASTNSGANWNATSAPQGLWNALASSADGTKLLAVGSDYRFITNGFDIATIATTARIYSSANSGASWSQAAGTPTGVSWTSAASSADGWKMVAGATSGAIYTSTNSGSTWTLRSAPIKQWNSIASSADGTKLVAVAVKGGIYTSVDSGATWIPTSAPSDLWWWSVASSADGVKLVAVSSFNAQGNAGGPIFVSTNSGTNWVMTSAPSNNWVSVAASADATTLVAAGTSKSPAGILGVICLSRDSGATWVTTNPPNASSRNSNWRCVAASADGKKLFAGIDFGGIYTSSR